KKIEIKQVKDGNEWRVEDGEYIRNYTLVRGHSKVEGTTRSMTDGLQASDLGNFGTKEWIQGLLDNPMDDKHFGLVKRPKVDEDDKVAKDADGKPILEPGLVGMRGWKEKLMKARKKEKWDDKRIARQEEDFKVIADLLIEQSKRREDRKDQDLLKKGQAAFFDSDNKCSTCHRIEVKDFKTMKWDIDGDPTAPNLANYASADWIRGMI